MTEDKIDTSTISPAESKPSPSPVSDEAKVSPRSPTETKSPIEELKTSPTLPTDEETKESPVEDKKDTPTMVVEEEIVSAKSTVEEVDISPISKSEDGRDQSKSPVTDVQPTTEKPVEELDTPLKQLADGAEDSIRTTEDKIGSSIVSPAESEPTPSSVVDEEKISPKSPLELKTPLEELKTSPTLPTDEEKEESPVEDKKDTQTKQEEEEIVSTKSTVVEVDISSITKSEEKRDESKSPVTDDLPTAEKPVEELDTSLKPLALDSDRMTEDKIDTSTISPAESKPSPSPVIDEAKVSPRSPTKTKSPIEELKTSPTLPTDEETKESPVEDKKDTPTMVVEEEIVSAKSTVEEVDISPISKSEDGRDQSKSPVTDVQPTN